MSSSFTETPLPETPVPDDWQDFPLPSIYTNDIVELFPQEVDYEAALARYRKTADMTVTGEWMQSFVARASFNLGFMHQFGIGIGQDPLSEVVHVLRHLFPPGPQHGKAALLPLSRSRPHRIARTCDHCLGHTCMPCVSLACLALKLRSLTCTVLHSILAHIQALHAVAKRRRADGSPVGRRSSPRAPAASHRRGCHGLPAMLSTLCFIWLSKCYQL